MGNQIEESSADWLGAISIGVGGIASDSAAASDHEFADCRGAFCANEGRAGRSLFAMHLLAISLYKMSHKA
jgi:hypothetical protein